MLQKDERRALSSPEGAVSETDTFRFDKASLVRRSASVCGEPIVNFPAGMTIITGQPLAHSLKSEPGLAACAFSCSPVSTVGPTAVRQRS